MIKKNISANSGWADRCDVDVKCWCESECGTNYDPVLASRLTSSRPDPQSTPGGWPPPQPQPQCEGPRHTSSYHTFIFFKMKKILIFLDETWPWQSSHWLSTERNIWAAELSTCPLPNSCAWPGLECQFPADCQCEDCARTVIVPSC